MTVGILGSIGLWIMSIGMVIFIAAIVWYICGGK
jgi:hypothetical protein